MSAGGQDAFTFWYKKGVEAMGKQNWDYAIECFQQCRKIKRDNVLCRQLLRQCEFKKYNDNKSGAGMLAKSKLIGIRSRIKKARSGQDWNAADDAAEEGLLINPWDSGLNADLGQIAAEQGFKDVAKFSLGLARTVEPNNKDLNRMFADVLEKNGEYTEAAKVWEHLCRLDPNDGEARSKVAGLHTMNVTDRGGYDDAATTRDVKKPLDDHEINKRLGRTPGQAADAPGMSVENDLRHAIRKDPANKDNYIKLGDYLRRNKKLEEARTTFQKALEVSGGDHVVREMLEDTELDLIRRNLEVARERSAGDDETAKQHVANLTRELRLREIEIFSARIQRYPNDMKLRFELAQRFIDEQKWQQAIPHLQKVTNDPKLKPSAFFKLGICFLQDKKLPLAKGMFERAIPDLNAEQHGDTFLDAHYWLARICEKTGDKTNAEKHYSEVILVNYDYKDARERLEKIQEGDAPADAG